MMVARWDATFCSFRGIGRGGLLPPRRFLQGRGPLRGPICEGRCPSALPTRGRSSPPPRVTFVSRRKSPKACQGGPPEPPEGDRAKSVSLFAPAPPAASRTPSIGVSGTSLAGFATLRLCEQLAFLSPRAPLGEHPLLSNRGTGGVGLMVTEGWERRNFGFCKINSALFWQQIIHK